MRHLRAFIRGKWSLSYFLLQLFLPGLTWPLLRIVNASVVGNRVSPYIVSAALAGDPVPLQIVPPGQLDRNDFMNMRLLAVPMAVFLLASCGGGGGKSSPPLRISPAAPPTAADRPRPRTGHCRENGRRHRPVRSSRTRRTGMPITVSIRMSRTRAFSRLWVPAPRLAIDRARGRRRRRPGRRPTRRIISRRRASRPISRACWNRSARTTPMPEA